MKGWWRQHWFTVTTGSLSGAIAGCILFWGFWVVFSAPYGGATWVSGLAELAVIVIGLLNIGALTLFIYLNSEFRETDDRISADMERRVRELELAHGERALAAHLADDEPREETPRPAPGPAARKFGGPEVRPRLLDDEGRPR